MSNETTDSSGIDQPGVSDTAGEGQESSQPSSKDTVQYSTYQKVLAEKKRVAEQNAAIQQQLNELLEDRKKAEESKLTENQEYKKLLDLKGDELNKTIAELTTMRSAQANAQKLDAFLGALGGKVERKYWGLVNLEEIIVDPSTGEVDEMSVTKLVEDFRKDHGRLIDVANAKTPLPNEFPKEFDSKASGFKDMTLEEKQQKLAELIVSNQ